MAAPASATTSQVTPIVAAPIPNSASIPEIDDIRDDLSPHMLDHMIELLIRDRITNRPETYRDRDPHPLLQKIPPAISPFILGVHAWVQKMLPGTPEIEHPLKLSDNARSQIIAKLQARRGGLTELMAEYMDDKKKASPVILALATGAIASNIVGVLFFQPLLGGLIGVATGALGYFKRETLARGARAYMYINEIRRINIEQAGQQAGGQHSQGAV